MEQPLELERLRLLLLRDLRASGCAVYRWRWAGKVKEVQVFRTLCPYGVSREEQTRIAESILRVVLDCAQQETDKIVPRETGSSSDPNRVRWWHFIIASGAVLDAGYVISVVLPAEDEMQVRSAMREVQKAIIAGNTT
jgi:hypothetical protein